MSCTCTLLCFVTAQKNVIRFIGKLISGLLSLSGFMPFWHFSIATYTPASDTRYVYMFDLIRFLLYKKKMLLICIVAKL